MIKYITDKQSPQHFVDYIKDRIICCEYMNETLDSLYPLTLDEIFWLNERITIRENLKLAAEKDEAIRQSVENIKM